MWSTQADISTRNGRDTTARRMLTDVRLAGKLFLYCSARSVSSIWLMADLILKPEAGEAARESPTMVIDQAGLPPDASEHFRMEQQSRFYSRRSAARKIERTLRNLEPAHSSKTLECMYVATAIEFSLNFGSLVHQRRKRIVFNGLKRCARSGVIDDSIRRETPSPSGNLSRMIDFRKSGSK